ncbi:MULTISPECIES: DivIVA domain-containing protein [Microbacterium]|uniref:DivIVA domain-containing protein n=1 Tax=Microbacterium TaxID=33882 RepID=UPI00217E6E43|nr:MULTISPECIES: DivIVA domain-containing protein [Microbacterium]UWF77475.1 DivIVA domain-containing protein [Microbacterium neungamense]WCM55638.1 DivIVA domain-containing protein [Microbacterium sp. EF45047]
MSETHESDDAQNGDFFDQLLTTAPKEHSSFTQAFRGYDKAEVDAAIATLRDQLRRVTADLASVEERHRAELDRVRAESETELQTLRADSEERVARLEEELAAARAQAEDAAQQVSTLASELAEGTRGASGDEPQSRAQFEAVLRVAEEQASVLIHNAATQAERLLQAAREEAEAKRAELDADVARITAQAQHDADQVRLKIETEYTAHQARIEREAAHAAEKVAQAEQEAATIRTEAEKGAAALRAMVTRETTDLRAAAEREVREMNARVLEFEETLTRRQDDAQQEFLVLHNQAVAHAERITADANEQVQASLEHAQRISAKAEDYERLMRSQAQAIEADAQVKAREILDRARVKAQKIVETVTAHATGVLRDAEDRTRQLRWQQQQLTSFMAEVRELIRPEGVLLGASGTDDAAPSAEETDAPASEAAAEPDGVLEPTP